MSRLPTYYVSHGGGPWPWMREQNGTRYAVLEASLQAMAGLPAMAPLQGSAEGRCRGTPC